VIEPTPASATTADSSTALLDASCRGPVSYFFVKAVGWLVIGFLLLTLSSIKWHAGGFLAECPWLTLGRVRPAAFNALLYGFALQAGLGTLLWLFTRLGRNPLLNGSLMVFAGVLWNFAVLIGVISVLAGYSTGFRWLEMPLVVVFLLGVCYALVGTWAIISFHLRTQRELFVSQWYLLTALFCFPWFYSAANYLLLRNPVRGVMQVAVDAWFTNGFLWLCLVPMALATVYYFLPKFLGRPLESRALAALGFWFYIFAAPWMGFIQYTGGPFPVWMISASIGASILFLVPLTCIAINWGISIQQMRRSPNSLFRFTGFAAAAFLVGSLLRVIISVRSVSNITQFTLLPIAVEYLLLFGFIGMAFFGAIYYIMPRVTALEWPSPKLINFHFSASAAGIVLVFIGLGIGGLIQGVRLHQGVDPNESVIDALAVTKGIIPFIGVATLGVTLLFVGQLALAANCFSLMRRFCAGACRNCCGSFFRSEEVNS
jgi:cytochrome c oxidase cbb3-type subunit 1